MPWWTTFLIVVGVTTAMNILRDLAPVANRRSGPPAKPIVESDWHTVTVGEMSFSSPLTLADHSPQTPPEELRGMVETIRLLRSPRERND